jgi:hypothetical protein
VRIAQIFEIRRSGGRSPQGPTLQLEQSAKKMIGCIGPHLYHLATAHCLWVAAGARVSAPVT